MATQYWRQVRVTGRDVLMLGAMPGVGSQRARWAPQLVVHRKKGTNREKGVGKGTEPAPGPAPLAAGRERAMWGAAEGSARGVGHAHRIHHLWQEAASVRVQHHVKHSVHTLCSCRCRCAIWEGGTDASAATPALYRSTCSTAVHPHSSTYAEVQRYT